VVPNLGLSTGTYTATVTVSGGNVSSASFTVSFTVASVLTSVSDIGEYLAAASGGGTDSTPVSLSVIINLDGAAPDNWEGLLEAIGGSGKYVALDLSDCTMSGTEFDPGSSNPANGKNYIASLVLPDAAGSIAAMGGSSTFSDFNHLRNIEGANITTIGANAFKDTPLRTAIFTAATSIGEGAFNSLNSHYVQGPFTITLGDTAPTLGKFIFGPDANVTTITVKRPAAATGYGTAPDSYDTDTVCWGNGFRGGGWDGSAMLGGTVRDITLSFVDL
jgi:hypothetical protein